MSALDTISPDTYTMYYQGAAAPIELDKLAEPQRDISAESAADRLRVLSEVHYTQQPASPPAP